MPRTFFRNANLLDGVEALGRADVCVDGEHVAVVRRAKGRRLEPGAG